MRLMEMTKRIQNLKTEFNKEIQTLARTQDEMKMDWKSPIIQPEKSKETLTSRMNQAGDRLSGLEDKVQDLDKIRKEYEKEKTIKERNIQKTQNTMKRQNLQITGIVGEGSQVNGIDQIFTKIRKESFQNPKKDAPLQIQEHKEDRTDKTRKENPHTVSVKTPCMNNNNNNPKPCVHTIGSHHNNS